MKNPLAVAGVPSTDLVAVPIAVVSHVRRPNFPVFDVRGAVLSPGNRTVRDTEMVYILADGHADLLDTLRQHLTQLVAAPSLPELHRAWTLHFVLHHEVEQLVASVRESEPPLGLPVALEALTVFLAKTGRAPQLLLQIIEDDPATLATVALHTAIHVLILAQATGVRRVEQLSALAFGAVFADVGVPRGDFARCSTSSRASRS